MASSPLRSTWLCAGVLLAAAPLLGVAAWSIPPRVQVSVCNQGEDLLLKDVRVGVVGREWETPLHGMDSLGPGDCVTTELKPEGEGSVRLAYRVGEERHDKTDGYVEGGYHAWLMVRGPGRVDEDTETPGLLHPPHILIGLAMLCFIVGGTYVFLGCVMFLEDRLRRELAR